MPPTDKYKIYYSSENADMMDGAAEFAMQFDRKSFRELLVEIEDFNDEEESSDFTAMYFRQELDDAEKYLDSTERGISDEIQALADEITEGCYSDFEKANAIRNYFLSGDYSYQLGFRASGSDIETFIFEDKDPVDGIFVELDGMRTKCVRLDHPLGEKGFMLGEAVQYTVWVKSDVPICACFGRLDVRQTNMAYYSVEGFTF